MFLATASSYTASGSSRRPILSRTMPRLSRYLPLPGLSLSTSRQSSSARFEHYPALASAQHRLFSYEEDRGRIPDRLKELLRFGTSACLEQDDDAPWVHDLDERRS